MMEYKKRLLVALLLVGVMTLAIVPAPAAAWVDEGCNELGKLNLEKCTTDVSCAGGAGGGPVCVPVGVRKEVKTVCTTSYNTTTCETTVTYHVIFRCA